jgi:hypothetical protein
MLDVTNPYNITAVANIISSSNTKLDGVSGIATFESRGYTYMAVASAFDNAVQIIRANIGSPVITLEGDNPVTISVGVTYSDKGATCTDDIEGIITMLPPISTVNTASVGTYDVTYSCVDGEGNHATDVSRRVIAVDTTPPVITLTGPNSATVPINASYDDLGASCLDNVDGLIAMDPPVSDVDTGQAATYSVTYSCTDNAGNNTVKSRTVTVQAESNTNTPPQVSAGPDREVLRL